MTCYLGLVYCGRKAHFSAVTETSLLVKVPSQPYFLTLPSLNNEQRPANIEYFVRRAAPDPLRRPAADSAFLQTDQIEHTIDVERTL